MEATACGSGIMVAGCSGYSSSQLSATSPLNVKGVSIRLAPLASSNRS